MNKFIDESRINEIQFVLSRGVIINTFEYSNGEHYIFHHDEKSHNFSLIKIANDSNNFNKQDKLYDCAATKFDNEFSLSIYTRDSLGCTTPIGNANLIGNILHFELLENPSVKFEFPVELKSSWIKHPKSNALFSGKNKPISLEKNVIKKNEVKNFIKKKESTPLNKISNTNNSTRNGYLARIELEQKLNDEDFSIEDMARLRGDIPIKIERDVSQYFNYR